MPVTPSNALADAQRGIQLVKLVTGAAGSAEYASTDNGTTIVPPVGSWTDRSGSITSGGTSQQVAAANTSRKAFEIQNISDEVMWLGIGVTAAADSTSFKIAAGDSYYMDGFISTQAINIIGATTGKKFVAKEA